MGGYDLHTLIITSIVTALFGGGLGGYIVKAVLKNEARTAVEEDFKKVNADISRIEKDYVTCAVCQATHNSVNITLADMNRKLDLLLEAQIKK